jgi:hypothetical protein
MNDDPRDHMNPQQKAMFKAAHAMGQKWVTDDAFAKRFKAIVKQSKQSFEKDGQHPHLLTCYLHDEKTGKMSIDVIQFADWPPPEGKKELTLMGLGAKVAENNKDHVLVMVSHISEGWGARQQDYEASGKQYIGEMNDDDRIEILIVSLTTQDLRQSYQTWRIYRDAAGKFKHWGRKPELEDLYNPDSDINPLSQGDFIPHAVIKGYSLGRRNERDQPGN